MMRPEICNAILWDTFTGVVALAAFTAIACAPDRTAISRQADCIPLVATSDLPIRELPAECQSVKLR